MDTTNFKFSKEHTWASGSNKIYKIGISDFAQEQLGEIIFIEQPETDDSFQKGEPFGVVESAKSVSELYMPISGKITGVNLKIEDEPETVNNDPYSQGWMIEIDAENESELEQLLSVTEYEEFISP